MTSLVRFAIKGWATVHPVNRMALGDDFHDMSFVTAIMCKCLPNHFLNVNLTWSFLKALKTFVLTTNAINNAIASF